MKLGVLCINSTSEEVARRIWRVVKAIGLSGDDLEELIDEARPMQGLDSQDQEGFLACVPTDLVGKPP